MTPYELTASITVVANTLACRLDADEISLLASVLVQLGDTLSTIALKKTLCENSKKKPKA